MHYAPFDRLNPHLSAVIADGLCGALLAIWILALVVHSVRDLLRARDALAHVATRLRPGVHTVRGVARWEAGTDGSPVSLTIHQTGEQLQGKHGPYVMWREARRDTRARPFYVELPSGERLRVEPSADRLTYVDDLAVSGRAPGANQRTRTASLDPGEAVYVRGELQRGLDPHGAARGYRDGGERALIMRPAPDGMLVSSQPVDQQFRRRASHNLAHAALGVALLGVCQLMLFDGFRALRRQGERVDAVVTGQTQYSTRHKGRERRHYVIAARLDDGTEIRDEVSEGAWHLATQRLTMPFTVARRGRLAQVGSGEVGLHQPHAIVACLVLFGLFALQAVGAAARRPWFERRTLVEREPGTL